MLSFNYPCKPTSPSALLLCMYVCGLVSVADRKDDATLHNVKPTAIQHTYGVHQSNEAGAMTMSTIRITWLVDLSVCVVMCM